MNVLVTGSRGLVGSAVARMLRGSDSDVVEYDLAEGRDILDVAMLERSMRGCDAIVHAAALLGRPADDPHRIMSVNLQGTWSVLACAAALGVRRMVFLSSVDALGVFKGERAPEYLPLDDAHPCRPGTPYGISARGRRRAEDVRVSHGNSPAVPLVGIPSPSREARTEGAPCSSCWSTPTR